MAPAEEQPTGYLKTNSGGVNLRKKAGYTDTIGRVDKNVVLPYFGEPTKVKGVLWYRVKHPTLGYGYLHGTYVNMCNADGTAIATPTPAPGTTPAPINTNSQTEASDNLVKDQYGTILFCHLTRSLQKVFSRHHHTHVASHRLNDECCHLMTMLAKELA